LISPWRDRLEYSFSYFQRFENILTIRSSSYISILSHPAGDKKLDGQFSKSEKGALQGGYMLENSAFIVSQAFQNNSPKA
jgi:hypothetical protein